MLDSLAMRAIVEDVSQGFRLLWRVPGFAIPIVLLLCLGITAASVSFSVLDALLLRPLSVLDPESLVRVVQDRPRLELTDFPYSFYLALRQHAKGLRDIRAAQESNTTFLDGESLERLRVQVVSESYFGLFGVGAHIGRVLLPEDQKGEAVTLPAVLSYAFWRRRYHENNGVLGRKVLIQDQPFVIVGVLPKGFTGASIDISPDVRVPLAAVPALYAREQKSIRADDLHYEIIGRLRSGVLPAQARDEAFALYRSTLAANPAIRGNAFGEFRFTPIPRGVSRLRAQFSNGVVFLMIAATLPALHVLRLDPAAALRTDG